MPKGKSKKPVKITLFHADWCGHCKHFTPLWDEMKADKKALKNIDFEDYEESVVGNLPESVRVVDGNDIRENGWPTIKITINDENLIYSGRRTPEDIYGFIVNQLKGVGNKEPAAVTMSDSEIRVSTKSDDVMKALDDFDELKGGRSKKQIKRLLHSSDFSFLENDIRFSEVNIR